MNELNLMENFVLDVILMADEQVEGFCSQCEIEGLPTSCETCVVSIVIKHVARMRTELNVEFRKRIAEGEK